MIYKKQLIEMITKIVKEERRRMTEAKFRAAKVTYSDGTTITTSLNPNVTDQQIKDYFKVGRKANIGSGGRDKIVTIKSVEILPDSEY